MASGTKPQRTSGDAMDTAGTHTPEQLLLSYYHKLPKWRPYCIAATTTAKENHDKIRAILEEESDRDLVSCDVTEGRTATVTKKTNDANNTLRGSSSVISMFLGHKQSNPISMFLGHKQNNPYCGIDSHN
eukprot:CAMPEP_0194448196 /NCGR_PEP_ID=MMETSP0176-20130528/129434_1 /TAXON_ID=216777 /ORGANISM="Proboscia alata, Strain PI-D3" /LENGTH=129 /DNA_ID=CAMNT_0039275141 /DNA_START=40 /DNA_END=429 /DNA_ORIENTATION=+